MSDKRILIPEEYLRESISHTDGETWWGGELPAYDGGATYAYRHFLVRLDTRDNSAQVLEIDRGEAQHLMDKLSLGAVAEKMGATIQPGHEHRARMRDEMLNQFAPDTEMPEQQRPTSMARVSYHG